MKNDGQHRKPNNSYKILCLKLLSGIKDGSLVFVKQDNKVIQINVSETVGESTGSKGELDGG